MGPKRYSSKDQLALEVVAGSMYSLNFLRNASDAIFDDRLRSWGIGEIYDGWTKRFGMDAFPSPFVPYSLGAVIGYLYCGILFAKEAWFDLLPDTELSLAESAWGFEEMYYSCPLKPRPTIKYVFRRLRNALGHGNISLEVIRQDDFDKRDKEILEKNTIFIFHDKNQLNEQDIFDARITLFNLSRSVRMFYKIVSAHFLSNE